MEPPGNRVKVFYWLILGCLSTYFAEVWSGSQIYSFYNLQSYMLVIPLYTLHILFLWALIWRYGRPWLYALFPAGCLFGLYEAYITKVLWNPTWGTSMPRVFGIALIETMVLVLFWHCFMSFIIPLFVAETIFTDSSEMYSLLPDWGTRVTRFITHKKLIYVFPVLGGLFQSLNAASLVDAALSGIITTLYLVVLLVLWRRYVGVGYRMRDLLPDSTQFKIIGVLLLGYYVVAGFLLRPEELPRLGDQFTIWVLYFFFGVLLYFGIKKSVNIHPNSVSIHFGPSPQRLMVLGGLISLGSVLGFVTKINVVFALATWLSGILFGLYMLAQTIRNLLKKEDYLEK